MDMVARGAPDHRTAQLCGVTPEDMDMETDTIHLGYQELEAEAQETLAEQECLMA